MAGALRASLRVARRSPFGAGVLDVVERGWGGALLREAVSKKVRGAKRDVWMRSDEVAVRDYSCYLPIRLCAGRGDRAIDTGRARKLRVADLPQPHPNCTQITPPYRCDHTIAITLSPPVPD